MSQSNSMQLGQDFFRLMPESAIVCDSNGIIQWFNEAASNAFSITSDQSILTLLDVGSHRKFAQILSQVSDGESVLTELVFVQNSWPQVWSIYAFPWNGLTSLLARPMSDNQETVFEMSNLLSELASLHRESSRQRFDLRRQSDMLARLYDELDAERQRLLTVIEQLPDGILITGDTSGEIIMANQNAATFWGLDQLPRNLAELPMMDGNGDRLPLPSIPLMKALESGQFIGPVEVAIPHRQRQQVTTAQVSARPIVSGSGQVTGAVMSLVDVTERNRMRDELVQQAEQDPLTKLGNRRLLFKRVEQALEAAPVGSNIGVLYLDVDGFKEVNDLLGHQAGDDVLIVLTERIRNVVRETDTIARIGGDEFAVAISDIPVTDSASIPVIDDICRRLLEGIAEPINIAGNTIELTASIGVAVGDRSIITKPDDLVQFADLAMYKAKTTGKARWAYYVEPEFLSHVWENDISTALPNALENNEFELWYRPVVQLRNGRLSEIEPVIVWPALGNETADDAIQGIAWRAGELAALIQRVCELFEHHTSSRELAITTDHPILVNRRIWIDHLRDTAVSSALVKLAESLSSSLFIPQFALIGRLDNANSTLTSRLRALSDAGASITLDRVGSSDSSLDLLQLINITSVELAGELISRAVNDSGRRNLIRGIAALTNELGIMLKATGVNTRQEFDLAGNLGCQLAAGPYIGQPMSAVEFSKWNSERSLL